MAGRKRDTEVLTKISALVPVSWLEAKEKEGVTWRALIKRGFLSKEKIFELNNEVEYFVGRAEKLTAENRDIKARLMRLEENASPK